MNAQPNILCNLQKNINKNNSEKNKHRLKILLLSLITFKTEEINMLSAAFYERIIGAIGEENLSGLSASQEATLIRKYKALLNKKGGDLDEITYDDLFEVWAQVK